MGNTKLFVKLCNYCWRQLVALSAALAIALALAGCGRSASGNADNHSGNPDSAQLFTVPADQMSHVQVLTIQPTSLTRTLRLTGAVAYDAFHTTPVITQVSVPVSRIAVVPGQTVQRGQPMLYVASPDYSQLRTNYLKAGDAYALAQKMYVRAQTLYQHGAISQENLEQAESAQVQAEGDLTASIKEAKQMRPRLV